MKIHDYINVASFQRLVDKLFADFEKIRRSLMTR